MSENYPATPATMEISDATTSPDSSVEQNGEDVVSQVLGMSKEEVRSLANELGSVLDPILDAHGDKIVICRRLGGAEMTLSQAVNTIWPHTVIGAMLIEGLPSVQAEIEWMLANQVQETEEPEEEEDLAEEEEPAKEEKNIKQKEDDKRIKQEDNYQKRNTKTKVQKTRENEDLKKVEVEAKLAEDARRAKLSEPPANISEKTSTEPKGSIPAAFEMTATADPGEVRESARSTGKAERNGILNNADGVTGQSSFTVPRTPAAESAYMDLERETVISEPQADLDSFPFVATQGSEAIYFPVGVEVAAKPEVVVPPDPDIESPAITSDHLELTDENIEPAEDEPVLLALDSQNGADDLTDFDDGEVLLFDHTEAIGRELEGQAAVLDMPVGSIDENNLGLPEAGDENLTLTLNTEPDLSWRMVAADPELFVQASLPIEEIEDSLTQLAERIEASEPEEAETVNKIWERIIEAPAQLEADDSESPLDGLEVQEELEKLFTELLDTLGFDYTPELIESLARLTIEWRLADEAGELKGEEGIIKDTRDRGTHEIIKQLLAILCAYKKSLVHADEIGKPAVRSVVLLAA